MKSFASCDLKDVEGLSGQLIGYSGSADISYFCCNLMGCNVTDPTKIAIGVLNLLADAPVICLIYLLFISHLP